MDTLYNHLGTSTLLGQTQTFNFQGQCHCPFNFSRLNLLLLQTCVWSDLTTSRTAPPKDRRRTDGDLKQTCFLSSTRGLTLVNGYEIVNSEIGLSLHLDINKHLLLII